MPSLSASTLLLDKIPLLSGLSAQNLAVVRRRLVVTTRDAGTAILEEGTPGQDRLYIVIEGQASLCKKARSPNTGTTMDYEIAVREQGDVFGEMPFLDGKPVSVTVIAKTPLTVAMLDLTPGEKNSQSAKLRHVIIGALQRNATNRLRQSLDEKADRVRLDAEGERYRNAVANIIVTALCLLSFYTLALRAIPTFESYLMVNFAASPFIIVFFAAIFLPVIRRSKFPLTFFGIGFGNWKQGVIFSLQASAAFIASGILLKWLLIETVPSLRGLSVISFADVKVGGQQVMLSPWYWAAVSLYLVLTPVQEFIARCSIQAPLYAFLHGDEWNRRALSIVVSNLVFSAAHAHISFQFAIAAFVPGIFWGWIFARTNSLLAVSLSHFIIGGAGIFLFGIEEFVARIT